MGINRNVIYINGIRYNRIVDNDIKVGDTVFVPLVFNMVNGLPKFLDLDTVDEINEGNIIKCENFGYIEFNNCWRINE